MAVNQINYNRGTTYSMTLTYTEDGAVTDITGATIRFTVKTTEFDADDTDVSALIKKTITSLTNPTAGIATITINPSDSQDIVPGKYFYDIKIEKADNTIYKLVEGRFVIDGSPTNRQI